MRSFRTRLICRSLAGAVVWVSLSSPVLAATGKTSPGEESAVEALSNPLPHTKETIKEGRTHYLRHCQICHGFDGKALENIDFEAADLTNPSVWRYGTSDRDLFRSTKEGAGEEMPPFASQLTDEEIWQIVHFLRSIGPRRLRPEPAEPKALP